MAKPAITIKWNINPLRKLANRLQQDAMTNELAHVWAVMYSAFARRRFKNEGDGTWQPLSQETIERRRKGKRKSGSAKILRDTGTLFNALEVGTPGNLLKKIRNGIRFGFAPVAHKSGGTTIQQIAIYHDLGKGNNPERKILVPPDEPTIKRMVKVAMKAIDQLGKQMGGKA